VRPSSRHPGPAPCILPGTSDGPTRDGQEPWGFPVTAVPSGGAQPGPSRPEGRSRQPSHNPPMAPSPGLALQPRVPRFQNATGAVLLSWKAGLLPGHKNCSTKVGLEFSVRPLWSSAGGCVLSLPQQPIPVQLGPAPGRILLKELAGEGCLSPALTKRMLDRTDPAVDRRCSLFA